MHILNFSHPLTETQLQAIQQATGQDDISVTQVKTQFDLEQPFAEQVVKLLDILDITSETWQSETWLVALPALNYITATLLAELHGRMGHFPAMIRLRPVADAIATTYEFAEIINLERLRQNSRTRR